MQICDPRKICLEYRLDIFFRTFVLVTHDKRAWKEFCMVPANHKVNRKENRKESLPGCGGLFQFEKSMRNHGQKRSVLLALCDEKLYPTEGATRISIALHLQLPIKYDEVPIAQFNPDYMSGENPVSIQPEWIRDSEYFTISEELMEQFFAWKKQWETEYYNA